MWATGMNLTNIMLSEISRHKKTNIVGLHSHEVPRIDKIKETKIRTEALVGGHRQEGEVIVIYFILGECE